MNIEFKRLVDTEYKAFANDQNAFYCEYNAKRDRSSFAGIAYEVIDEKNLVFGDIKEQLFKEVSTYEKKYLGMDDDYCESIKDIYSQTGCKAGIKVLFLVYSDVKSSQMAFELLFTELLKKYQTEN